MRNFSLGFLLCFLMGATFNAVATRRADLSHVDSLLVFKLVDGGIGYQPNLTVPTETTLPDGGQVTTNEIMATQVPCELLNGAARTNVLNFMNNQGQSCGLAGNNLGN